MKQPGTSEYWPILDIKELLHFLGVIETPVF